MRSIDPKVYSKSYYYHSCLGSGGYDRFRLGSIPVKEEMRVLDLGCGKGDTVFFLAQKGASVVGIDYSEDAIALAQRAFKKQQADIQKRVSFFVQDAKQLDFPKDSFDGVVSLDVFEHLYPEELEVVLENIAWVLKKDGFLFVHTEANKIYADVIHPWYVYPMSRFLVWINTFLTGKTYPHLPKDPRNALHKKQHVNEPTYFSLKNLFNRHKFLGHITLVVPTKPLISWKDAVYNVLVYLYPLCRYFPINILFAYDFVCIMRNNK